MIRGELDGESTIGAGIIFGSDADNAYVVTANHVVRRGPKSAARLQILLRGHPEHWIEARLTEHFDRRSTGLDVAVLAIENPGKHGLVLCDLPLDKLPRQPDKPRLTRATRPAPKSWLGVRVQDMTSEMAEYLGLQIPQGALVAGVVEKSPAQTAGLKSMDIIAYFDGKPIDSPAKLIDVVGQTTAGKIVPVQIIRSKKLLLLNVKPSAPPKLPEPEPVAKEENSVNRGDAVYPVGYPLGAPWGTPVEPDRISSVVGDTITFQSAFIAGGHSGGALFTEDGDLVGMITSDQPPFGVAVKIERILERLQLWNYSVYLHAKDAMHQAVIRGETDKQHRLIKQCPDIVNRRVDVEMGQINWAGCTPLHMAALQDRPEAVRLLLDHGANPDLECYQRNTPLDLAVRYGVAQTVKNLLTHPRGPRPENSTLNYLLREALFQQDLAKMQVLVDHGADVNYPSGFSKGTLLHEVASWTLSARESEERRKASVDSHVAVAKFLLAMGLRVDQQDNYGRTALHIASEINHSFDVESNAVSRLLIESGANIDKQDNDGNTPLHVATYYKNVKVVKVLIEFGADVNRRNKLGQTPLHRALAADINYGYRNVNEDSVLGIVTLLVNAGAEVNALTATSYQDTPLDIGGPSKAVREYLGLLGAVKAWELDDEDALRKAREAARQASQNARFQIYMGKALQAIDSLEPALAAVLEALRLDRDEALAIEPDLSNWLINLSYSMNLIERYEKGMQAAGAAILLDPKNAYAYANKAFALGHLGHDLSSLNAARTGVELLEADSAMWAMLGFAENLVGSYKESIAAFERALVLMPLYFETMDPEHKAQLKALKASRRGQKYLP